MDAKRIADRYVSRAGGDPNPTLEDKVTDLVAVANFILWHEDSDMRGGVLAKDAYAAFCRLLNLEPHRIRAIIRDEPSTKPRGS